MHALPLDPQPTVTQMVKACTLKALTDCEASLVKAASQGTIEALVAAQVIPHKSNNNWEKGQCFNCGEIEHYQQNCSNKGSN